MLAVSPNATSHNASATSLPHYPFKATRKNIIPINTQWKSIQ